MEEALELEFGEMNQRGAELISTYRQSTMFQQPDPELTPLQEEVNKLHEKQNEEDVFKNHSELQELELSKTREHDALSLTHRLRIESEMLAKTKAKEEVMTCILSSHIQAAQDKKEILANEFADLKTFKEELDQKMKMEIFQRSQIEKEMNNNVKTIQILKHHYDTIEIQFESVQKNSKKIELQQAQQYEQFQSKKLQDLKQINQSIATLESTRKDFQIQKTKYTSNINRKNNAIKILTDTETQLAEESKSLKESYTNLLAQQEQENLLRHQLSSQNQLFHNSINSLLQQIQTAEEELSGKEFDECLDIARNNLNNNLQQLTIKETTEVQLQGQLKEDTSCSNETEIILSNLDDENMILSTSIKGLEDNIHEQCIHSNSMCASLDSNLLEITNSLNLKKCDLNSVEQVKSKKETVLCGAQQEIHASREHASILDSTQNQLQQSNATMSNSLSKLEESAKILKGKKEEVSMSLVQIKEKYIILEQTQHKSELELTEKLSTIELKLSEVKEKNEKKIITLKDELESYKDRIYKADQDNKNKYNSSIRQLKEQLTEIIINIEEFKENVNHKKLAITKEQTLHDVLQRDRDVRRQAAIFEDTLKLSGLAKGSERPTSILKSSGTPTTPKKVSFEEPSVQWLDNSVYSNSDFSKSSQQGANELLFDELLRASPPQRLQDPRPIKKSRFDSP